MTSVRTLRSSEVSVVFYEIHCGKSDEPKQSAVTGSQLTSEQLWFGQKLNYPLCMRCHAKATQNNFLTLHVRYSARIL